MSKDQRVACSIVGNNTSTSTSSNISACKTGLAFNTKSIHSIKTDPFQKKSTTCSPLEFHFHKERSSILMDLCISVSRR